VLHYFYLGLVNTPISMKKALIITGIVLVVLVAVVVAIPFVFKDKINAKVKEEINNQLNAQVDYGDFGLSLIRTFPNFSFSLDDLSVVGKGEFKGDTLAYIPNFNFTLDLMSVINGSKYKILALNVTEPMVNAKVSYSGKANWDIMKPSKSTAAEGGSDNFALEIKSYKISKGNITYDDKPGNMYVSIKNLDFEGSGDVTQDVYDFVTKTAIEKLTYRSGAVAYLSDAKLDAKVNLTVDNAKSKYTFKENEINLNDLGLEFDGYVALPKNATELDVKFKSKQTEFKSILSLIPAVYKKDFDKIKTSGSLKLNGYVKGQYAGENYPAFNLNLAVNNGMFQYPDLPVAVKNVFITSTIIKPQGSLDLVVVDVSKLHLEAGSDPIDATINVRTPISDPNVKATVLGRLDLANVPKFYPMEGLKTLTGLLVANLSFAGRMSDVDKKNYEAIKASGSAKVTNLVYDSKDVPMPLKVADLQLGFNPKNVTLSNLDAVIGKSDFKANGSLDNFMAYAFGKGDLLGVVNLQSRNFDANEWLQKDENAPASVPDTATKQFFKVPAHIDFTANSTFGKISYENMALTNVKGDVRIKDEAIILDELFANLLGGSATITAKYDTKGRDYPDVTFTYDIDNFDIQQTYKTVGLSEKLAPVMKFIQGNFSSDLKGSGRLNPDMSVDYNSLTGDGKVEIPYAKVVNMPVLTEITKVAKIPALQNLELKNAWTLLRFNDGKVKVEPTDIKFGNGYNINFTGTNGFDQTIDYDVKFDVPSKELGPATSLAQGMLAKVPGMSGAALPDMVGFVFKVTGTAAKPKVQLSKVTAGGGSVKDMVTNAAEDLKKKAEEEAKKQAEELKKKAEDELNKQKAEAERKAKEAIDKAKADAEKKAKEAADKAKKDAEQKLKDAIKWPK
jgi:hypothetical protein